MTFFAHDVSFLEERDSEYRDQGNDLSVVCARLVLWTYQDDVSDEQREIMHGMYKNLPVRYRDGIFRISKVCEAILEEDRKIWEIEIEGTFTSEDPNGRESNGWKEEEIADNSSREVHSAIAELEV